MTALKGLRALRDATLAARHLDIAIDGLDGYSARFRPITVAETNRETARTEKAKDKHAANIRVNAALLGLAFLALVDEQGEVIADGLTDELLEEFCPDLENPSSADAIKGLFTDDAPLFKAGAQLARWSLGEVAELDEDVRGN